MLLDVLNEALARGNAVDRIDVFAVDQVPVDGVDTYIPGIGDVAATPLVGFWRRGILSEKAFGWKAITIICRAWDIGLTWNRTAWRWDVRWG